MHGSVHWLVVLAACGSSACGGHDQQTCDPATQACGDGCTDGDSDGDGWSDEIEVAMDTSPTEASDNPSANDQIVFVMPYQMPPHPAAHDLETTAKLARADVAILLDTTGSMTGTTTRIQGELGEIVQKLSAEVDDIAFGAAGYGDFPYQDFANSDYDVPFYLVHRMMTARTPAGLSSITTSFRYKNISDGLGNWFSIMRGGNEPEQHWEALRQSATGVGITYPDPYDATATRSIAPFNPQTAFPATPPAGEEVGTIGGLGFRADSTPIILQITDTNAQLGGLTTTSPVSATRAVALAELRAIGARVIGIMAYDTTGRADLTAMTIDTGGLAAPTAWGTGAARPANCPIGKCCVIAEDSVMLPQPDPVNGECTLVFKADFYSQKLAKMVVQGVAAVAHGVRFAIGAVIRDDPSDAVDTSAFVDRVEAISSGACSGSEVTDTNHDGTPDTFGALVGGSPACFRITPRPNTAVASTDTARRFRATIRLTGDGLASFGTREVFFVVPSTACKSPVLL